MVDVRSKRVRGVGHPAERVAQAARYAVEQLERRLLLASVVVTTKTDIVDALDWPSLAQLTAQPGPDGKVSLREAMRATEWTTALDTITFNIIDGPAVIRLTRRRQHAA